MSDYIDLHSHAVPAVDDGVKTLEDSVALLRGLGGLGFAKVVTTPHIRTAMFPNTASGLRAAFATLEGQVAELSGLPELGLGAEHYFDDVVLRLLSEGEGLAYPGEHCALVELPPQRFPLGLERYFFQLRVRGLRPVLAHPERYTPLFKSTDDLDPLLDAGALPLLDLMSLVGRYGRQPRRAAERMLEQGIYYGAASDAHRPSDVDDVGEGIERLLRLVGDEQVRELLHDGPRNILAGSIDD